ncbi:MAG TPA: hypothetical protein VMG60_09060 [Burkholderiaceae bacterium]|nr:hypothetical protein [Burkholderiaceae bacterium]
MSHPEVQRLFERQGYDYEAKFYPHPARLCLQAEEPRPMRYCGTTASVVINSA